MRCVPKMFFYLIIVLLSEILQYQKFNSSINWGWIQASLGSNFDFKDWISNKL